MRIMRLFKLVRHFAGLQSLLITLRRTYQEPGILIGLALVAILTYSSLIYVAERDVLDVEGLSCTDWKTDFWWGLMTITTVGYDLHPKTMLGKLMGGLCALTRVGH